MPLLHTAAAVATGLLTTGLAAAGVGVLHHDGSATAAGTATSIASSTVDPAHCGRGAHRLPTALRADLAKVRSLPAGQRGPALHAIREKALRGGYGTAAQRWSEHRFKQHARFAVVAPQSLRTDLAHLRGLPASQRKADRQQIRSKALAGGYGDQVRSWAQHRQEHRQACAAQQS